MRTEILHYFHFLPSKQHHKYLSQIGNSSQPFDRTKIADYIFKKIRNQKLEIGISVSRFIFIKGRFCRKWWYITGLYFIYDFLFKI